MNYLEKAKDVATSQMKKTILFLISVLAPMMVSAQGVIKGDMNDDQRITVVDITLLTHMALGKTLPYDYNKEIVGAWHGTNGETFCINADGTAIYDAQKATFSYNPYNASLLFYNQAKLLTGAYNITSKTESVLKLQKCGTTQSVAYSKVEGAFITGLTLSHTALTIAKGEKDVLTTYVTPSTALNKTLSWSSSDKSVATVDQTGCITAVGIGTCTVTANTTDGTGISAACHIKVTPVGMVIAPDTEANDEVGAGVKKESMPTIF